MKLVYLPLDSRPCNAVFPHQLAALRGVTLTAPSAADMDFFRTTAPYEPIQTFLERETRDADALVLAVDHLCFGSLLASREDDVPQGEALRRLADLAAWKAANPGCKVYAYNVIMRSAISTLKAGDVVYHAAVKAYSQAVHQASLQPGPESEAALAAARAAVPEAILAKYHRVRARNHAVNLRCVELAQAGAIDRLLLLQEDSEPLGIHRMEQGALQEAIAASGCEQRIFLHNGADEGGCLSCAAAIQAFQGLQLRIRPLYLRGDGSFTALYEDRPFEQNLRSHCAYANVSLADDGQVDAVLCIDTPPDGIQCDHMVQPAHTRTMGLEKGARRLAEALEGDTPAGLLDVSCANGGDGTLITSASAQADITGLRAYAAWNTASNSLGTVLAQLMCSRGQPSRDNTAFTIARLLDDWGYQGEVRARLDGRVQAAGEDPYCLADPVGAEEALRRMMEEFVASDPVLRSWRFTYACRLPWPRIFEAAFDVTLE